MATGGGDAGIQLPDLEQDDGIGSGTAKVLTSTSGKLKADERRQREADAKHAALLLAVDNLARESKKNSLMNSSAATGALPAVQPHLGLPTAAAARNSEVAPQPSGSGVKSKRAKIAPATVPAAAGNKISKQRGVAARQIAADAEKEFKRDHVSIFRQSV